MIYRFAGFEFDPVVGTLTGPDGVVSLRKQSARLLEVLLEQAPEVLDRDELLDLAWGRTALSPTVVPQAISELRRALGDKAQEPRCIETRHRRGYRVICPVEPVESPPADPETRSPATPARGASARRAHWFAVTAVLALVALAVVATAWWRNNAEQRWLEQSVLPEIRQLAETDRVRGWARLREVRQRHPDNPLLEQLWLDLSLPVDLVSKPSGASVEVRGYVGDQSPWVGLGRTPLKDIRLPLAQMRFRLSLEGYRTLEAAPSVLPAAEPFLLYRPGEAPEDMVRVSPGRVTYLGNTRQVPGFWIDRHEVTNREYRAFIDAGGYRSPEFWQHLAHVDGRQLSHDELMLQLVDSTGMPGPSTWSLGTYPAGEGDHPVEGISWYEAAAYARYADKQLPTAYHWYRAAGLGTLPLPTFSGVLGLSNFSGKGTTAVGALGGLGPYGTLDMAGNVAEWTVNSAGGKRHILGGSWLANSYQFRDPNAQRPLDRRPGFGLRLVQTERSSQTELTGNIPLQAPDVPEPVDDETFTTFARQFDYDPVPLEVRFEEIDESHRDWRRERVSFTTAYSSERMPVHVFLPDKGKPPYQAVVHMPGGDALMLDSIDDAGLTQVELFLRSGRAVIYPVYAGTFERREGFPTGPASHRDLVVAQVRDLLRTVDYLETRPDIDHEHLLLHALSYGALRAPLALAVDDRFRAAILLSVGLPRTDAMLPEVQLQNYLPRVVEPVLLITGRDDFNFPFESSHKPFFELLGTPEERKRHLVRDWGHIPPYDPELIRAHLDWTERWLGHVARDE